MFIEFIEKNGKTVLINTAHIVSIEQPAPLAGIQGGIQELRIHCLEGRVFSLDPKVVSLKQLRDQIDTKELDSNVRPDKGSPVR